MFCILKSFLLMARAADPVGSISAALAPPKVFQCPQVKSRKSAPSTAKIATTNAVKIAAAKIESSPFIGGLHEK